MADAKKPEEKKPAPFIKKVKKINAAGHHGGAWKIAYADFVTAMMAFFLLLWLLTTTPSKTLQGIADYFAPTIGLKDQMGIGFYGGKVPLNEGTNESTVASKVTIIYGTPNSGPVVKEPTRKPKAEEEDKNREDAVFKKVKDEILRTVQSSTDLQDVLKNISVTATDEGLRIDVFDLDQVSMFKVGSTELEPSARKLLKNVAGIIQKLPNHISVAGHTDSRPYTGGNNYTNWELSADRANASRRFLEQSGVDPEKISKIEGYADREHLAPDDPNSSLNRRISITLLYKSVANYSEKPAPDAFISNPEIDKAPLLTIKPQDDANNPPVPSPNAGPEKTMDQLLDLPSKGGPAK